MGDLRKILEGVPDDAELSAYEEGHPYSVTCVEVKIGADGEVVEVVFS